MQNHAEKEYDKKKVRKWNLEDLEGIYLHQFQEERKKLKISRNYSDY